MSPAQLKILTIMAIVQSKSQNWKVSLFLGCLAVAGILVGSPYSFIASVVCGAGIAALAD